MKTPTMFGWYRIFRQYYHLTSVQALRFAFWRAR